MQNGYSQANAWQYKPNHNTKPDIDKREPKEKSNESTKIK